MCFMSWFTAVCVVLYLISRYTDVDTSSLDFSEHTDYVISIGSYHMLLWMKPASIRTLGHIWTMERVDATTAEIESTKVLGVNKEPFEAGKKGP